MINFIFSANLYKFLILLVIIKSNFACTYEKRYDEIEPGEQPNVTKTRTVCCKGYIRNKDEHNKVICHPECKNCLQGYCLEPSKCVCNDGYTGENCTQSCVAGKWGKNCVETCNCKNEAQCDPKTGHCICAAGWIGKDCEQNTTKERINATSWVRVDETPDHDKILKNISSVLTKFTESVENLHKTVADVKSSNRVEETDEYNKNDTVIENLIEPAELADEGTTNKSTFHMVFPIMLICLSILLIILTAFLTVKIRKSIATIRKIQKNPTDRFRKKLGNDHASTRQYTPTPVPAAPVRTVTAVPVLTVASKPQNRQLPPPPSEDDTYDNVNLKPIRPESSSYVQMVSEPPQTKISPIDHKPVLSFVHGKPVRPAYLNMGIKLVGLKSPNLKASPEKSEEIYEDIKAEQETQYEELGHYAK